MPRLVEADAEQIIQTWRSNYAEWGEGLTTEQYIAREESQVSTYSSSTDLSSLPRQIHWLLVSDDGLDILAACESLYRPALRIIESTVERVDGYSIASVFVPPTHRGNGYGTQLMTLLSNTLRDKCAGSALFSDVGPTFYARPGWKFYTSSHLTMSVLSSPVSFNPADKGEVRWIDKDALQQACEAECTHVETEVERIARQAGNEQVWSFLPTYDVLRWHYARTHFMTRHLGLPDFDTFGCRCADGCMLWNYQPDKKVLLILRTRFVNVEALTMLLRGALSFASKIGADKIVAWDVDETLYNASLKELSVQGLFEQRTGSLNALQVYGTESVNWINKEKFCWC